MILNDACKDGKHALVSISSMRADQHHDPSCIVEVGEHDFIRVKSFIRYGLARIEPSHVLENGVYASDYFVKNPMDGKIVDRVIAGALVSDFASGVLVKYLKALSSN